MIWTVVILSAALAVCGGVVRRSSSWGRFAPALGAAMVAAGVIGAMGAGADVLAGRGAWSASVEGLPALAVRVDSLSLLVVLAMTGIALFLVAAEPAVPGGRRAAATAAAAGVVAVLGLVTADSLPLLFSFWVLALTGSWTLAREGDDRRDDDWRGLVVPSVACVAMLAGLVLLFTATGTISITDTSAFGRSALRQDPLRGPVLLLILAGAVAPLALMRLDPRSPGAWAAAVAGAYVLARLGPPVNPSGLPPWAPLVAGAAVVSVTRTAGLWARSSASRGTHGSARVLWIALRGTAVPYGLLLVLIPLMTLFALPAVTEGRFAPGWTWRQLLALVVLPAALSSLLFRSRAAPAAKQDGGSREATARIS